jgi:hypothetical protein
MLRNNMTIKTLMVIISQTGFLMHCDSVRQNCISLYSRQHLIPPRQEF